MIKYLKFIAVVFTLFISISAFSQPNNDTLVDEKMQIEQNMDSMLNLWYVKNSVKANSDFSYANVDSISYKNIPDSVFEARLKRIPSFIPLTYNKKVRDYIEFYLRHGKNTTRVLIGLSRYYYPIF